jgi:hypothetical protein
MRIEQTECSETLAYKNSDAEELPRRKHTSHRIRRKFEINNELMHASRQCTQSFVLYCIDSGSWVLCCTVLTVVVALPQLLRKRRSSFMAELWFPAERFLESNLELGANKIYTVNCFKITIELTCKLVQFLRKCLVPLHAISLTLLRKSEIIGANF